MSGTSSGHQLQFVATVSSGFPYHGERSLRSPLRVESPSRSESPRLTVYKQLPRRLKPITDSELEEARSPSPGRMHQIEDIENWLVSERKSISPRKKRYNDQSRYIEEARFSRRMTDLQAHKTPSGFQPHQRREPTPSYVDGRPSTIHSCRSPEPSTHTSLSNSTRQHHVRCSSRGTDALQLSSSSTQEKKNSNSSPQQSPTLARRVKSPGGSPVLKRRLDGKVAPPPPVPGADNGRLRRWRNDQQLNGGTGRTSNTSLVATGLTFKNEKSSGSITTGGKQDRAKPPRYPRETEKPEEKQETIRPDSARTPTYRSFTGPQVPDTISEHSEAGSVTTLSDIGRTLRPRDIHSSCSTVQTSGTLRRREGAFASRGSIDSETTIIPSSSSSEYDSDYSTDLSD